MKPRFLVFAGVSLAACLIVSSLMVYRDQLKPDTTRELAPDQPGEEENLNRELWKFAKKTPYPGTIARSPNTQNTDTPLPNGWKISPAGTQVEVGNLPYTAVLYAGKLVVLNTGWYGKDPQEVSVIDLGNKTVSQTLKFTSLFPSAKRGKDGDLYISGGFAHKIYRLNQKFHPVREYNVQGYAAGIAPINGKNLAVAYLVAEKKHKGYGQGKLAILNVKTGQIEQEKTVGYFPYDVEFLNNKLYVTLLGENKLAVYDRQLQLIKTLEVGERPQTLCTDAQKLYVVNTTSDSLSEVDTQKDAIVATIDVRHQGSRFGSSPTSCSVSGNRLYVTQAELNAVSVFDKNDRQFQGLIPTGWYPTKVLLDRKQLFALSAKGIHPRRHNPNGPQPVASKSGEDYVLKLLRGSVSIIPQKAIAPSLSAWTQQVEEGSPLYSSKEGLKLPIRHIFYIVKENRTYDQILGDLGRGNGDPNLTLFGQDVTPNNHQLAKDFVTLDHFFVNGEVSVLGHSFTTSGYASPFLEWLANVHYSDRYKGYPFGTVPATFSPTYLWNALEAKKVDYRIYGEPYYLFTRSYQLIVEAFGADSQLARKFYDRSMNLAAKTDRGKAVSLVLKPYYGKANTREDALRLLENREFSHSLSKVFTGDESLDRAWQNYPQFRRNFANFLYHYPLNYHYYDLKYSDLQRFQDWKVDFDQQIQSRKIAQFHYIWLPNDHTAGDQPGYPNPYQMVAQNDAALGKIVETISNSPIWQNSLILVVEDDAQNGPDHVDATRTVALAASPYVKRGAVISDRYDQLSLLRTIEAILGLDPLNQNDSLAAPMFGIFTDQPNPAAYSPPTPSKYLMEADRRRYFDRQSP